LTLIHRFGPVSSQIRSAMLKKTTLPKVEIETPYCTVTLVNAQIAKIASYHPPATGSHSESRDTFEQEEIQFSFQKIEFTWTGGGTTAQDDWTL
jgi:type VI secretion system Hcp family effector